MIKDINKLLIKKILLSQKSKHKLIRSAILIILIVALLIVSTVFINSMSNGIAKKFALLVNGDIQVYTDTNLTDEYDFIKSSDSVFTIDSLIYGREATQISLIKAVNDSYFNSDRMKSLKLEITEDSSNLPSIYISNQIATKLNLKLGDRVAIILAKDETKVRPKLLFIKGIFDSGYKEIDQNLCYMNLEDLKKIYNDEVSIHQEVVLKNNVDINEALLNLNLDNYISRAWYELQPAVYNNLLTSTQSLTVIFIVIALLTGYFISSISSDIITKDHKNIAINKLLGLKNKNLRKVYFLAIEFFTIISTLIGVILGIIISKTFLSILGKFSLEKIPALSWYLLDFDVLIPFKSILIISISLILISMISVYLSLFRIKKIEVLDLLNHE